MGQAQAGQRIGCSQCKGVSRNSVVIGLINYSLKN